MAYIDQYNLANTADFRSRVMVALCTAAADVMAEDPATTNHTARVSYAHAVLHNPVVEAVNMAAGVVTNVAITGSSTDSDIQFTVNSLFNAFSD